jgi:hypothetical protein
MTPTERLTLGLLGGLGDAMGGYREVEQPPAPPPSTTRAGPVLPDPERCRRVVGGHERSRAGRRRR